MSILKEAAAAQTEPDRFIIFLRHGLAEEPSGEKKDEDRGLTEEGQTRTRQAARGLARLFAAEAVYSSPLLRAVQTALWVSKAYRSRGPIHTVEALAPAATLRQFRALLKSIEARRVILVGHEPTLTRNMASLTGLDAASLELKKAGCYGIRISADGTANLEWLLSPKVLRGLGR